MRTVRDTRRSVAAFLISMAVCATAAPSGGRVTGTVVDPVSMALRNATIRAMPEGSGKVVYRTQGAHEGRFSLNVIEPGKYTIAVSVDGFRERFFHNVIVTRESETNLGSIQLAFAGCEAPTVICDSVSTGSSKDAAFSQGDIRVPLGCAADLDRGKVWCTLPGDRESPSRAANERVSDFRVEAGAGERIYLEPRNGAQLAEPNSARADCSGAALLDRRVRVDGLGPGSDVCIRSNSGRHAHLFLVTEVQPDSKEIGFHYVIWK